jgi:WD40 repeat protein
MKLVLSAAVRLCAMPVLFSTAFAQGPGPKPPTPSVWAIVIGVGRYTQPSILPHPTAARYAGDVRQWLERAGWDETHQLLLRDLGVTDPGEPNAPASNILPLKQNLDWAFREWLIPKAKPGDLVVIYFAGRARFVDKPQGPRVESRREHYLLPTDTIAADIELNGWSLDRAVETCAQRKLHVLCWLATSISEQGSTPSASPPARPAAPRAESATKRAALAQPVPAGSHWLKTLTRWEKVSVWLASDRPQAVGGAVEPGDHFTTALLESLGKPDRKRNLAVCLNELRDNPRLRLQGFRAMGGVPPELSLWKDQFGLVRTVPKPEMVLQVGHADKVTAMASPADGRQLITASMDSTVRIWSAADRSLVRILPGHMVGATAMALSRDDRWLVSGGGTGSVLIYERARDYSLKQMATGKPHNTRVVQIALLSDGAHFVSIDQEARSYLWDLSEARAAPKPWLPGIECREVAVGGKRDSDGRDTGVTLARCGDGRVRVFDAMGTAQGFMETAQGEPTTVAVSPDGRFLAVGFGDGKVVLENRDTRKRIEIAARGEPSAVRRLVFSSSGKLAVANDRGARLITLAPEGAGLGEHVDGVWLLNRPIQSLIFSPAGEYLAACTENVGATLVWRLDGAGPPSLVLDNPNANANTLGFTSDGRGLLIGDFAGALALRPLDRELAQERWDLPANRGKLQQLSSTPDRSLLCVRDEQRRVRIWNLKDRTCRRLRGTWASCSFVDDDRLAVIPDSNAAISAGRLVLMDRRKLEIDPGFFADKAKGFQVPAAVGFDLIAVSPDRKRIAAAGDSSKVAPVCVWETQKGRMTHWISDARIEDPVSVLCFSSDGRYLLTAGDSPAAKLWDLSAPDGSIESLPVTFSDAAVKTNVTAAALRPNHPDQVVTGHSDGTVQLWSWANGKSKLEIEQLVQGVFAGAVKSLCFSSDGQYLAAAGNNRAIWVGTFDPRATSIDVLDRLVPHHFEQINALLFWPAQPTLISASDDTTVRFWDLKAGSLRGTFSAAAKPAVSDDAPIQDLDWVFYTPDGRYDAPPSATNLVRYRRQDQPLSLDRFEKTHNEFRLAEGLLGATTRPVSAEPADPPPVTISSPPRPDDSLPDTKLTITLGAQDLRDVRLYHNDVLIPCGFDEQQARRGNLSFDVVVRLVPDRNRFYVMASQEGAYDSASNVVDVDCTAALEKGQLHIIALGVGGYTQRPLQYAGHDAEKLSEVLHDRGIDDAGQRGLRIVLPESELNVDSVEQAFEKVSLRVENRPQDTVVVFLAGHTGVFNPQRFCLLLPTFKFPESPQIPPVRADGPVLVAARDSAIDAETGGKIDDKFVLPYSVIALNLMKLKALHRLVIVDACQAEAILEDNQVRAIQKWMELSSRRARTSYLMAARRGEPALEIEPLEHGLFTYTLLRGMGAISQVKEPPQVAKLGLPPNADFDKNGVLSTSELDAYVKQVLPEIAAVFPQVVAIRRAAAISRQARAASPTRGPGGTARPPEELTQSLRLQSAESSFALVPLTDPARR